MRKNAIFLVLFALVAGAAGFLLRTKELLTAFDGQGLSVRGAPATLLLILLSAVFVVLLFIWVILIPREALSGTEGRYAFAYPGIGSFGITVVCGLTVIASALFYFVRQWTQAALRGVGIAFIACAALAGIAIIVTAISAFRYTNGAGAAIFSVLTPLFLCFWLIIAYRENAKNPDTIVFVYECFALGTAALAFYYRAGAYFGRVKPKMTIFAHGLGIYFGILTLADYREFAENLLLVALIVVLIVNLYCFVRNQRAGENSKKAEEVPESV